MAPSTSPPRLIGKPPGRRITANPCARTPETKELRRAHNRVRNWGSLYQFFLGHFRAQVSARGKPIASDDGHRDVVTYAGLHFGGEHVAGRSFEEFQDGLIFERRRIRDVHDD